MPGSDASYDITLSLDPAGAGVYRARLTVMNRPQPVDDNYEIRFPPQRAPGRVSPMLEAAFGPLLDWGESLLPGLDPDAAKLPELQRTIGAALFNAVFSGAVRSAYDKAYETAQRDYSQLQIRLQLHESLHNLPFELLFDPTRRLFLGSNTFTTLVRSVPGPEMVLRDVECPLQLLVVVAAPKDAGKIDVASELARMDASLKELVKARVWAKIDTISGPDTLEKLRSSRQREKYHVLHFIGHGISKPDGQTGLVLEDAGGNIRITEPDELSAVLAGYRRLRLIVLNSCHGSHAHESRPFGSVAHLLASAGVPAVVAMQRQVADQSAVLFGEHLYRAIANCRPIGEAVNSARLALQYSGSAQSVLDCFNPQLFLRSTGGQLFRGEGGASPVEIRAKASLAAGDIEGALAAYELAGSVEVTGLAGQLDQLAGVAFERSEWPMLQQLAEHCDRHNLKPPGLDRWRHAARLRLEWEQKTLPALRAGARSPDPIEASRTYWESKRRLDLLVHEPEAAKRELYGGDEDLWSKYRHKDQDEMTALQSFFRNSHLTPLDEQAIKLIDSLDRAAAGVECPVPGQFGDPGHAFFRHRPRAPEDLVRARGRIARTESALKPAYSVPALADFDGDGHLDLFVQGKVFRGRGDGTFSPVGVAPPDPSAGLSNVDVGLVRLVQGDRIRAIAAWKLEARTSPDRDNRLAALHHLALIQAADGSTEREDIAPWAVLLLQDHWTASGYWARTLGLRDPDLTRLRTSIQGWIDLGSQPPAAPPVPEEPVAYHRDLVYHGKTLLPPQPLPLPPPPAEPATTWFTREREAAALVERMNLDIGGGNLPAVGGPVLVRSLGSASELGRLHREAEFGNRPQDAAELRHRFSNLCEAWLAARESVDVVSWDFACSPCRGYTSEGALAALPMLARPLICRPGCSAFASANPLHATLDNGHDLFLRDVLRLLRRTYLRRTEGHVRSGTSAGEPFTEAMAVLRATRSTAEDSHADLLPVRNAALDRVQAVSSATPVPQLDRYALLLRAMLDLGDTTRLRDELTRILRFKWIALNRVPTLEDAVCSLREALDWSPQRTDLRDELAEFYLVHVRVAHSHMKYKQARAYLDEFRAVAAGYQEPGGKACDMIDEAERLRGEIERTATTEPQDLEDRMDDLINKWK